jgi:hypothetical protein
VQNFAAHYFPLFFLSLWLIITTVLGVLSGWFSLARRYPDQKEEALFTMKRQSCSMGVGVRMNGLLRLSVCQSGLRIGMMRVFGPFCRDFFVPWEAISISRRTLFFQPLAELRFGNPSHGKLILRNHVANRLAQAAPGLWPEVEIPAEETHSNTLRSVLSLWALQTLIASTFFLVVPRMMAPAKAHPPVLVAILFPSVLFGLVAILDYWNRRKGAKKTRPDQL